MNPVVVDTFRDYPATPINYERPVPITLAGKHLVVTHLQTAERRCDLCGTTRNITVDHIVPSWLYTNLHILGFKPPFIKDEAKNISRLCREHNIEKAGQIYWYHPTVRLFMRELADYIYKKLDEEA